MTLYIGIAHAHDQHGGAHRRGVRAAPATAARPRCAAVPARCRRSAEAAPRQFFWPGMQPIAAIEEVDPGIAGAAAPAAVSADASDEEFLASLSNRPAAATSRTTSTRPTPPPQQRDPARLEPAPTAVAVTGARRAAGALVEVEELKEGCRDGGPWPQRAGCPAAMVGCSDMVHSCDHTFSEVSEAADGGDGALQVAALCPRAQECGADDAAADPCAGDPRRRSSPERATGRGVCALGTSGRRRRESEVQAARAAERVPTSPTTSRQLARRMARADASSTSAIGTT